MTVLADVWAGRQGLAAVGPPGAAPVTSRYDPQCAQPLAGISGRTTGPRVHSDLPGLELSPGPVCVGASVGPRLPSSTWVCKVPRQQGSAGTPGKRAPGPR